MPFILTPQAVTQIKKIITEQKLTAPFIRAFVAGRGCSGVKYGLNFEDIALDDDIHVAQDDLKIIIPSKDSEILENTVLDFHEDEEKQGFIFNNSSISGCGSCSTGGCHS